jgi:hypothetical protein
MAHDSTIRDILSPQGYEVQYVCREKYRGSERTMLCVATRDGTRHYASKIVHPDHPDHHRRIQGLDASPRAANFFVTPEGIVLSVEASGQNLWETEPVPDPRQIGAQLIEFALWTQRHQLIHGDLRPWNVFFDNHRGVQVIDWAMLSAFVDDLLPRGELPPRRFDLFDEGKHYAKSHPELVARGDFTGIDRCDALLIGKLLKGEIGLSEAWPRGSHPSWRPSWCKP